MKKKILLILSALLTIITLCGFAISYGALLTTAIDSGINAVWGNFSTKYIWPLTVDFALLTFECGLFYVILFQPHLRRMMTGLVVSFVMLTVFFNVIHGLPAVFPSTATEWMKATESAIAWSLPPIVQCLGVLVLSKIFHGIVSGKEMSAREGIIAEQLTERLNPEPVPVQESIALMPDPPRQPDPPVAFRQPGEPMVHEIYEEEDHLGVSLGDIIETSIGERARKNLRSGSRKDVIAMHNQGDKPGEIAKKLNLPTQQVREVIASTVDDV